MTPSPSDYPPPHVVPPVQPPAQQILILLHGRGGDGVTFAQLLHSHPLATAEPEPGASGPGRAPSAAAASRAPPPTLRTAFPRARSVFPTASRRRVAAASRVLSSQWFDLWSLRTPCAREELQLPGLRESGALVRRLVREAVAEVGPGNVALVGLSQGCATALASVLCAGEGEDGVEGLAAVVGMCGWCPFASRLQELVAEGEGGDGGAEGAEDVFERESGAEERASKGKMDAGLEAVQWLREELEMKGPPGPTFRKVPFFLGHGVLDPKVSIDQGRHARDLLRLLGANVTWKEYKDLGHWWLDKMLSDIVDFLNGLGWQTPWQSG